MSDKPTYEELLKKVKELELSVAEHKKTDKALLASEARYRSYIDVTGQIAWVTNADGEVIEDVPSLRKFSGQTYEEAKGRGWAKALHPDDLEHTLQVWNKAVSTKSPYEVEYRMRRHDGVYRHLLARGFPVFQEDKSIREWVGTCIDITERKQIEEELDRHRNNLEKLVAERTEELSSLSSRQAAILKAVPDIIIEVDNNKVYRWANPAGYEFFGDEVIGKEAAFYFEGDQTTYDVVEPLFKGSEDIIYLESWQRRKDGAKRLLAWWCRVIKDEKGNVTGAISTARDITESKWAGDAIKLHTTIMETVAEGIFLIGVDDNIIKWTNRKFEEMFGYEPGEMIGMHVDRVNAPTEKTPTETRISIVDLLLRDGEWHGEIRNIKKDGTPFWCLIHVTLFDHPEYGKVMVSAHTDITDRKQAEEALLAAQDRYKRIIGAVTSYIFTVHYEDGHVSGTTHNNASEAVTGYSPEDFANDPGLWIRMVPVEERGLIQEQIRQVNSGQNPLAIEHRIIRKDGTVRWIRNSLAPHRDAQNRLLTYDGLVEDITERKNAEDSLRQSHQNMIRIFNGMFDALMVMQPDYTITEVNANFLKRSGSTRAEVIGRKCYEVSHRSSQPCSGDHQCPVREIFKTRAPAITEHIHKNRAGEDLIVEINAFPLLSPTGEIEHIVEITHDVTERKKAEAERAELESHLQQAYKMEVIGTMAGGIAHDFNNILTIIIAATEMAMDDAPEDSKNRYYNNQALTAARRATGLVRQILTFSRQAVQERVPLKPHLIIKEYLKLVRSTIPTTVMIHSDIDSMCGYIDADPTQLHQVIMNLCSNAVHAMDEKGVLEVELHEIYLNKEALAHKPGLSPGPYACLSVADTGCGMDQETMTKIFDPFFTTKEVGQGTGMGLSVVHGIVENHGGMITVESAPGRGSTFYVFFPILQTEVYIEKPSATEPLPIGTERILLVDDEENLIIMLGRILENQGYQVTAKTDSIDALDTFKSGPAEFDLLVTDQTMPNMSGTELAAEIMKIRPDLPIILCTGFSNKVSEEDVLAMGIKKLCLKPLDKEKITTTVRKVLDENKI